MYSVSASTGQNPLSSASYNAFGATALTFGSGDSDSFTYDPNTGRQIFLGIRQLIDWPSELSSFSLGGQQSFLRCTYCSAPTGPAQPPAWGQANPSPTPGPNNGPTPIDKTNATLRQCEAQAAAAAQPYMNDVKMPSANELVGTGVLATAASIFTKGNPIAIGISAASVLRKQIGGLINGLIAHNAEFAGCSISNGVNPIAFTGSF